MASKFELYARDQSFMTGNAAVFACTCDNSGNCKILLGLQERKEYNESKSGLYWNLIGGKRNENESTRQAAAREFVEEVFGKGQEKKLIERTKMYFERLERSQCLRFNSDQQSEDYSVHSLKIDGPDAEAILNEFKSGELTDICFVSSSDMTKLIQYLKTFKADAEVNSKSNKSYKPFPIRTTDESKTYPLYSFSARMLWNILDKSENFNKFMEISPHREKKTSKHRDEPHKNNINSTPKQMNYFGALEETDDEL